MCFTTSGGTWKPTFIVIAGPHEKIFDKNTGIFETFPTHTSALHRKTPQARKQCLRFVVHRLALNFQKHFRTPNTAKLNMHRNLFLRFPLRENP